MNKTSFWAVISLAIGHLVTDLQAGALPIVLPHLKEMFSLTYAQMAAIVLTQNVTSSVIQPIFGYITDKRSLPTLLPYCAALAGAGFAAIGWVSSYALLLLTVIVIGVSSASYHPQASKTVNFLSDENSKAQNMGLFSLGGNAGMAAGSMILSIPPIWALDMVYTEFAIVAAVGLAGFFIIGSNATTIVLAQTMLPNNVGMAAGLTIGFSVGLGGLGVTILGVLADNFGLPFVIQLLTWLSIGSALVTLKIPIPESMRKKF